MGGLIGEGAARTRLRAKTHPPAPPANSAPNKPAIHGHQSRGEGPLSEATGPIWTVDDTAGSAGGIIEVVEGSSPWEVSSEELAGEGNGVCSGVAVVATEGRDEGGGAAVG